MPIFTLDNPAARPVFAALRGLFWRILSPCYRNGFALHLDPVTTRAARTRWAAVVEVALHEDGSGLEVAARGWVMMTDVVLKRGREAAPAV